MSSTKKNTVRQNVMALLEEHESVRDSDKKLWLAYLNRHYNLRSRIGLKAYEVLKEIIFEAEAVSTIIRERGHIQNKLGMFIGNVAEEREEREQEMREEYGYGSK